MTGPYEVNVEAKDGLTAGVRRPPEAGENAPVYLAVLSVNRETALDVRFWRAMAEMVMRAHEALRAANPKKVRRRRVKP